MNTNPSFSDLMDIIADLKDKNYELEQTLDNTCQELRFTREQLNSTREQVALLTECVDGMAQAANTYTTQSFAMAVTA